MPALSTQVKRKNSSEPKTSKGSRIEANKMFESLKVEQLHSWAQLVEMKRHDSNLQIIAFTRSHLQKELPVSSSHTYISFRILHPLALLIAVMQLW